MEFDVVLEARDGFMREEKKEFTGNHPNYTYILRQYDASGLISEPQAKDRTFYLKAHFYAFGKHIAYYKE